MMEQILGKDWFRCSLVTVFGTACTMAFGMILFKSFQPGAIPVVLTALLAGYAIADLVSGIVHSLADHLGTKDTPIVGALFIQPFREHHDSPEAITGESLLSLCIPAMVTATPPMLIGLGINLFFANGLAVLCLATLLWIVPLGGVLACITHRLAHDDQQNPWIHKLQDWGVILPKELHEAHHRDGHYTRFCILNGWMNPLLDYVLARPVISKKVLRV